MNRLDVLSAVIDAPQLAFRKINQAYNWRKDRYNAEGIDIMSQDWDNLIILDACRYDTFKKVNYIKGDLQRVISRGSATLEFLQGNLHKRSFHDTIYVTGNPMLDNRDEVSTEFFNIDRVWADEGWDDDAGTVFPETMLQRAIRTHEEHPNKRLLIHFVQPHYPFIADFNPLDASIKRDHENAGFSPWMKKFLGRIDIPTKDLVHAYEESLEATLPVVDQLISELNGKSIVTSDHGNVFGERVRPIPYREWGHPPGVHVPGLVQVPWLECPVKGRRRKITQGTPMYNQDPTEDRKLDERLSALGYVE